METILHHLVGEQRRATPEQLARLVAQASSAAFATDLLEADEPLWGGFWHFDVISAGYRLPAVELAWLRAVRLDRHWPEETSLEQFLADLHQAVVNPAAGIWTLAVAGEPCAVFAAPSVVSFGSADQPAELATVVWYCATTNRLHAGYRTWPEQLVFAGAVEQRPPGFKRVSREPGRTAPDWVSRLVAQMDEAESQNLAVRLDRQILRFRAQKQAGEKRSG